MRITILGMLLAVALAGCEPIATDESPVPDAQAPGTQATNDPANQPAEPDNTAVNERDADGATKTPIDQDESQADVSTTAKIREQITSQEGMSINARNVKVMTSNGRVTLRGPVDSSAERETIERIAQDVAGAANVDSQIEVINR
ncbi:MAG TPA: BON domain-containing protein [Pirellulaceae bacterium]|nr:BON domain-containing protein [Pirellulaceae bacterium]